ncbi:hypothetical protein GUH09_03955, partial [Xanthomonas citri pv. citri]|nr:hypothetical protein [Xanthomonas citri pv. citri]
TTIDIASIVNNSEVPQPIDTNLYKKEISAAIPSAVDKEKAVIPEDSGANEEHTTELIQATCTSEITTDDDERARKEPK